MSEDMKESAQETTPIRIVELDPKWWLHGEGSHASCLLRDDGKMCCLGFDAVDRGIDPRDIIANNIDIAKYYPATPKQLMSYTSNIYDPELNMESTIGLINPYPVEKLMQINDYVAEAFEDNSDAARVALLNEVLENSTLNFRFKLKDFSPSEKHGD